MFISPSQINTIFLMYANINSLKFKNVIKNFFIRCDDKDNTKNLCNSIAIVAT